jgi:hypothetical protein
VGANLLVIRDAALADKYTANWKAHAQHSESYEGKETGYSETHHDEAAPAPAASNNVTEGFLASKNSQVFHKAGCPSAAKISEKHLVRYNTRTRRSRLGSGRAGSVIRRGTLSWKTRPPRMNSPSF